MQLRSPGLATDLQLVRLEGHVHDRFDYIVAQTPSNPSFYWGNFLVFSHAPGPEEVEKWARFFEREFAHNSLVRHVALAWDCKLEKSPGTEKLIQAGYELTEELTLTANNASELLAPQAYNKALFIRPLQSGNDWTALLKLEEKLRPPEIPELDYAHFLNAQIARYERLSAAGHGQFFGAFAGAMLVGAAGLFLDKQSGLARFQRVGTDPDFRRQGVCSTLVHKISKAGFDALGAKQLVIVADPAYAAARIYERLGFKPTHYHSGALLRPVQKSKNKLAVIV